MLKLRRTTWMVAVGDRVIGREPRGRGSWRGSSRMAAVAGEWAAADASGPGRTCQAGRTRRAGLHPQGRRRRQLGLSEEQRDANTAGLLEEGREALRRGR